MFDIKCVYAGIYIDVEMNDAGVRIELTRNARDLIQNQRERESWSLYLASFSVVIISF